jgi:hypothetical protein
MATLKLYMLLLGSKAPGRHVEQHDFFFGIANSLKDLVPDIKAFWPETGGKIHIDGWRELRYIDGYRITVHLRDEIVEELPLKLFFINLGGYQENKFEEQHYTVLTVKSDRAAAFRDAKNTSFFKTQMDSHIDDKYGVDVDDLYEIDELLPPSHKNRYKVVLTKTDIPLDDKIHLGYVKLTNL